MPTTSSFDERFDVLAAIAYRVAYRLIGDRHDAENLTQEALARAYVRWPRIRDYDEAWVTRVTTNLAIGHWRRARRSEPGERDLALTVDHMAQRMDLAGALRRLPRRQREVLALRYLVDLSEADTAARLGCAIGTVKQHASRGLRAMRGLLDEPPPPGLVGPNVDPNGGAELC